MFLIANKINKFYQSGNEKLEVLIDLDFDVEKNTFYSIMGESGSGKSTLLHILGLLDNPNSGEIMFDGINVTTMNDDEKSLFRKSRIGFLFQHHHLLEDFTTIENISIPYLAQGYTHKEANERAENLLEPLGLLDRKKHFPSQLSGGESQRVALARALINSPDILIADEPTGDLDKKNTDILLDYVDKMINDFNLTAVIATHNPLVANRTDKTLFLKDGFLQSE